MRTLLVLPQFEQVLSQQQGRLKRRLPLTQINAELLLLVRVAVDETLDEETLLDVVFGGYAHQQLAYPAFTSLYHLALLVSEWSVRYRKASCSYPRMAASRGIFTSNLSFWRRLGNSPRPML
jgi:hypothetical protein